MIDTLSRFKPRADSGGKRSQYDEDREAVDPLAPIASEHNIALLVVHHLREMESDDPLDIITGSVGLTSGVDGALVLKRQRGNANAFLHVDGRDIQEPTELALLWDATSAKWIEAGNAEDYAGVKRGRRYSEPSKRPRSLWDRLRLPSGRGLT
jgi:hypothetical protein